MEFFRWFLILAGVAMLVATYMLGRRKVDSIDYRKRLADEDVFDPSIEDLSVPISGRPSEDDSYEGEVIQYERAGAAYEAADDFLTDEEIDDVLPPRSTRSIADNAIEMGLGDEQLSSSAGTGRGSSGKVKSFASAVKQANQRKERPETTDFAAEFEAYPEQPIEAAEEKIVTVHITARGGRFNGATLKRIFEEHDYQFGKMAIYHCHLEQEKVFSVANLVKPGSFDIDDMDNFTTPGITLFMKLPVTLDADVAFDFLIREATELAEELGGQLRDADRSTLSKQTIQHMREDIQQYMFRQKRAAQA